MFGFLSREVTHLPLSDDKEMYATHGSEVLCFPAQCYLTRLAPCSQEEADTRLLLHVADAVQKGRSKDVTICTVDTDVVLPAVALFDKTAADELWIALGTGSSFRYLAVHEMVATMDPRQCPPLPIFHGDTVAAFAGREKQTVWKTWKAFPEVTDTCNELRPRHVK